MDQYKIRLILVLCGAAPFFFLSASWANAALMAYLPTAVLFGLLLPADYPPIHSRWFWKAMAPTAVLHIVVVIGLIALNFEIPALNRLPRILVGFVGIVAVLEWRVALLLIQAFEPKSR
jgi:hypothetical protein